MAGGDWQLETMFTHTMAWHPAKLGAGMRSPRTKAERGPIKETGPTLVGREGYTLEATEVPRTPAQLAGYRVNRLEECGRAKSGSGTETRVELEGAALLVVTVTGKVVTPEVGTETRHSFRHSVGTRVDTPSVKLH